MSLKMKALLFTALVYVVMVGSTVAAHPVTKLT